MNDTVLIRVSISTNKVGSECVDEIEFDRDDWEGMTDEDRETASLSRAHTAPDRSEFATALESIIRLCNESRTGTKRIQFIKYIAETALGHKPDAERPEPPPARKDIRAISIDDIINQLKK